MRLGISLGLGEQRVPLEYGRHGKGQRNPQPGAGREGGPHWVAAGNPQLQSRGSQTGQAPSPPSPHPPEDTGKGASRASQTIPCPQSEGFTAPSPAFLPQKLVPASPFPSKSYLHRGLRLPPRATSEPGSISSWQHKRLGDLLGLLLALARVLLLAGTELIFLPGAGAACFGFGMRIPLITHGCCSCS